VDAVLWTIGVNELLLGKEFDGILAYTDFVPSLASLLVLRPFPRLFSQFEIRSSLSPEKSSMQNVLPNVALQDSRI
jgi:hypothetical protein